MDINSGLFKGEKKHTILGYKKKQWQEEEVIRCTATSLSGKGNTQSLLSLCFFRLSYVHTLSTSPIL